MRLPTVQFKDDVRDQRKLVLILYACVSLVFLPLMYLQGISHNDHTHHLRYIFFVAVLIFTGTLSLTFRLPKKSVDWIYPVAIVPTVCCGIAFISCVDGGLAFIVIVLAPLVWASILEKLILMTPANLIHSVKTLEKPGVIALLAKPVRLNEFTTAIEHLLNGKISSKIKKNEDKSNRELIKFVSASVLVAEDYTVNQMVISGMLQRHGINAEFVSSGKEAVNALKRNHYDLIFMDLQMPEMDGFEATGRIRNEELSIGGNHRVPIIALTAYAMKDDREKCLSSGMDDYLCKPVATNELASILEKWLGDKIRRGIGKMADPVKSTEKNVIDSSIIFDYKGVCDRLTNDTDLIKNVLKLYFSDTPPKVALIKKAVLEKNYAEVEMLSHAIKGASANVGLERIRSIATVIEQAGRAGDLSIVPGLIQELDEQFAAGEVKVQKILSDAHL